MKLDTTEAVLEWADGIEGRQIAEPFKHSVGHVTYATSPADTATASRLALAMRVLAIVEKAEREYGNKDMYSGEILAEASAEQGDGK